ncbi:hypothetical protein HK44_003080 [Pseudomonas fluorescens HK44]|uniref:Uncharacterized protein n=1 Tax=Pseudomonas fluorescens HK44 TaxID=1042209 RepID=A0A010T9M0_PSEFL|nr:hypothetical protein HK44_003080 [Pseudomonas fluorescens HK44]
MFGKFVEDLDSGQISGQRLAFNATLGERNDFFF